MGTVLFILCALGNAAVAILHVVIVFRGAPGYRAFGAGETLATLAEKGSPLPALLTLGIAAVLAAFTAWALSAAGLFTLPFTQSAVLGIASIYTLRGLLLGAAPFMKLSRFDAISSAISLALGLMHFVAVWAQNGVPH
ncbi:MAG: hypothetical protein HY698_05505 [Deltaproteobacteria bacterium]|nr:hypothetical protein [Deltaproteobacteria bacterium]